MILTGLVIVHIVILLNLKFTAWPEIFSFSYLFNNGFDLYKDMVHPYTPLLTLLLSFLYKLFGYNVWVVKLFTYLLVLINDLLIFKITIKLTNKSKWGIFAVIFYVLTQSFLDGNQLWFDFAISTPILFCIWLILNKKYFWTGVVLAVAFLVKQNSLLFLPLLLIFANNIKNSIKLLFGAMLPVIPFAIYLYLGSSFADFFNWTLIYPSQYWTNFPNYVQILPTSRQLLVLIILFMPSIYLFVTREFKNKLLIIGSLLVSLVLIYPRFSFFHFQTGIAFLSIIFGVVSSYIKKPILIYAYLLLLLFLIPKDWGKSTRFIDDNSLLVEKSEKVYLLGSHSLNYVFSNSLPPKPWIDNYGWYFDIPGIQQKLIDGWKIDPPVYIYWSIPQTGNWYDLGVYQPTEVVKYIRDNYQKIEEQNGVEIWKLK
ncbi:MAG: hypothetical protein AAB778_04160 [Patescibacteria group bacterium]